MKKKKKVVIRVTKVAPKRYLIEQRRKFMWLWEFWQKGCPTLGLNKYYSNKQVIRTVVQSRATKLGMKHILIFNSN